MKIALISDIHGNHIALEKVLNEIKASRVDHIICLGDVATLGPEPGSVIQQLSDCDCRFIMGNHDEFMIDPDLIHTYTEIPIIVDAVKWTRDQLTEDDIEFIKKFEKKINTNLNSEKSFLFYHGSPQSNMEDILPGTPDEDLDEIFADDYADIMAGGHTHLPMMRQFKNSIVLNPGSVGLPFKKYAMGNTPEIKEYGEYMVITVNGNDTHFDFRQVKFDVKSLVRELSKSDNPLNPFLHSQYP